MCRLGPVVAELAGEGRSPPSRPGCRRRREDRLHRCRDDLRRPSSTSRRSHHSIAWTIDRSGCMPSLSGERTSRLRLTLAGASQITAPPRPGAGSRPERGLRPAWSGRSRPHQRTSSAFGTGSPTASPAASCDVVRNPAAASSMALAAPAGASFRTTRTTADSTLRRWVEHVGRNPEGDLQVGVEPGDHARQPVGARPRRSRPSAEQPRAGP